MSFKNQNDVTPSNAMADIILQWQLMSARLHFQNCDFVVSYNTFFSIGYIGEMCLNIVFITWREWSNIYYYFIRNLSL